MISTSPRSSLQLSLAFLRYAGLNVIVSSSYNCATNTAPLMWADTAANGLLSGLSVTA